MGSTVLTVLVAATLALALVHVLAPQRAGPLALTQIFAPHLFLLVLLLAIPAALGTRSRPLGLAVLALAVVAVVRVGPSVVSVPALEAPDATRLAVATWNVERGGVSGARAVSVLAERPATVIALQELTPAVADAIEADPRVRDVYPHRILRPDPGYVGMGLLSTVPLDEIDESRDPAAVWALVRLPDGPAVRVVNAHPFPASFRGVGPVPVGYDPHRRDRSIAAVRAIADASIARGEHVLVLGDFNVTEREPAYDELTAGLHDAHRDVGQGPGFSWRPAPLKGLPLGLVRIDYLLGSRRVRPQSVSTDCTPRGSDHCLVSGIFELPPGT